MRKVRGKAFAIGRVYAGAILELAEAEATADAVRFDLVDLNRQVEANPDLKVLFTSPTIEAESRATAIEKIFRGRLPDLLVDALQVMNRKGRLDLLPAVVEAYAALHEERRGRVEVNVVSAVALSDPLREPLRRWARQATGKEADLLEEVDSTLLGGIVVQVGDRKYDLSLSRRLAMLRKELLERASEEIHAGRAYVEGDGRV